jgi:hypothetical protein
MELLKLLLLAVAVKVAFWKLLIAYGDLSDEIVDWLSHRRR